MDKIIQIDHLCKSYGSVQAVQDISFVVKEGELFAFLGVNGAGKSTTIHILCGQLPFNSGTVVVNGHPLPQQSQQIKSTLGVVFQNSLLDGPLTVQDNLKYRAALYGLRGQSFANRLSQLAELLDFGDLLKRPVNRLSGGQRRRVDIARALLHNPKILILDEPTTGLDPQSRQNMWNTINRLRHTSGLTVFLTTHYMEEAAEADYVVILNRGQICAKGTPLQLKNTYAGDYMSLYGVTPQQLQQLGCPAKPIPGGWRIKVQNTGHATRLILQHPDIFTDYEITKGKMDDVFLAATNSEEVEQP